MIIFYCLLACISSIKTTKEVECELIKTLGNNEIKGLTDEYYEYLEKHLSALERREVDLYFIKDIDFHDLSEDQERNILVWDLGGTYFKLSNVKVTIKNKKIEAKTENTEQIPYPNAEESKGIYWEDWASEKMIDYVLNNNILPDASSLIVSYPLCHTENDSYVETFTKFFAFERPVKRKIMEAVRESISKILVNKKEKLYEKFQIDNIEERLAVKTVVNDSVASYFSSKLRSYDFSISIILGTGTNAAFNIEYQDEKYVLNSEWGSFTPKSIEFWEKEIEIFKKMEELYNKNVNFLDVIAANGCKFDLINSLLPPDHEKITKENYKEIIENSSDLRAKIYKVVMERSKQIIAALTLAAIRNSNKKSCLIVTNGSGFDNPKDSEAFKEIFDDLIQNVIIMGDDFEVEFLREEGLTLIGSALYTLHRIIY